MYFGLDSSLFQAGDGNAAWMFWEKILPIANAIIVIILLIVIFSQLTGWGIDNYGIKKMLPKLILMAVLINLSFLICQLAIDLSNILGKGIVGLFKGISNDVMGQLGYSASSIAELSFASLFTGIFASAVGATAVSGTIIAAVTAGATFWWIPLLALALVAVISVVIFFLLLAVRKLLAVILVIISPLAFICYILPNTQNLFKKWLEVFKGVLVVYPVCAALYGISLLMKVIACTTSGVHIGMIMVALLMAFVPLLVAPSMIKKSLAALSGLGEMITRMGDRAKRGVNEGYNSIRGTQVYKDAERRASINRAKRNNEAFSAVRNGTATRRQRIRNALMGGERGFARNQGFLERSSAEDVETSRLAMREETGNYDTNIMGTQLSNLLDKIDRGDTLTESEENKVRALTAQLSSQSGGAKKIYDALKGRTGNSAQLVGSYLAQNDKAKQSLEGKSRRTASRISDIAAGVVDSNTTQEQYDNMNNQYLEYRRREVASGNIPLDENSWRARENNAGNAIDNTTVVQHIAKNVLDKDKDFVSQSKAEVTKLTSILKGMAGGQARIDRMANNPSLFGYGDVSDDARQIIVDNATPITEQDIDLSDHS